MVVAKAKTLSKEQQADLYEIGNRIREARENAKMTQNDLADLLERIEGVRYRKFFIKKV